jgi:NDP-sugar pyrophosphorylase family protein
MSAARRALECSTAIILSAGELPDSVRAAFGKTSPAMLPINGRPIIHWSISYLKEQGVKKVIVAVRRGETRVQQFSGNCFARAIELTFVEIGEDRGPGYSLAKCLEKCARFSSFWAIPFLHFQTAGFLNSLEA